MREDPSKRLHSWAAGWAAWAVVKVLSATWDLEVVDPHDMVSAARRGRRPLVVSFWHRHILSLINEFAHSHTCAAVSQHQDGEYAAQALRRFGFHCVRGSTSRGAVSMLRALVGRMAKGRNIAVAVDGPRGPRFRVQPGIALLARRLARPVCPLGIAVRNAWVLNSWDAFVIPKPWSRIVIAVGDPLAAGEHPDAGQFCKAIRQAMFEATERARQALG